MAFLQITLKIAANDRAVAAWVYQEYKTVFLDTITGAKSKKLLIRDEDVQVLHSFDSTENANAYLQSELFTDDVISSIEPFLDAPPDMRIYQVT